MNVEEAEEDSPDASASAAGDAPPLPPLEEEGLTEPVHSSFRTDAGTGGRTIARGSNAGFGIVSYGIHRGIGGIGSGHV